MQQSDEASRVKGGEIDLQSCPNGKGWKGKMREMAGIKNRTVN